MPLPDPDQVRQLGLPKTPATSFDPLLEALITTADQVLAQACLFPRNESGTVSFETSPYVQFYRDPEPYDPRRLTLGLRPIGELTEVAVDTNGDWTYASVADLDSDVLVDEVKGQLYLRPPSTFVFTAGVRSIRVSATAGFDVSNEPPLVQAIALQVAHWASVGQAGTLPVSSTLAGASASYRDTGMPAVVRELIEPYRLFERETHWRHR